MMVQFILFLKNKKKQKMFHMAILNITGASAFRKALYLDRKLKGLLDLKEKLPKGTPLDVEVKLNRKIRQTLERFEDLLMKNPDENLFQQNGLSLDSLINAFNERNQKMRSKSLITEAQIELVRRQSMASIKGSVAMF